MTHKVFRVSKPLNLWLYFFLFKNNEQIKKKTNTLKVSLFPKRAEHSVPLNTLSIFCNSNVLSYFYFD